MERATVNEEKLIEVFRQALRQPGWPPVALGGVERVTAPADGCNWNVWWVQVRDTWVERRLAELVAPLRMRYVLEARRCRYGA